MCWLRWRLVPKQRDQQVDHGTTHLPDGLAQRGQAGLDVMGNRHVVEAGDGDVAPNF